MVRPVVAPFVYIRLVLVAVLVVAAVAMPWPFMLVVLKQTMLKSTPQPWLVTAAPLDIAPLAVPIRVSLVLVEESVPYLTSNCRVVEAAVL